MWSFLHFCFIVLKLSDENQQDQRSSLEQELAEAKERCERTEKELAEAQDRLACYEQRDREEEEQHQLALSIWGARRKPDATWDQPAVLLTRDDRPLTVGRVVSDLGYRCTSQRVHRISALVQQAYVCAHGRVPIPVIYYDSDGIPERVTSYTESDRDLIETVIRAHCKPLRPAEDSSESAS